MRYWAVIFGCALGLVGCNTDRRDEPVARQAGREAYKVQKQAKKAAKELGQDLKQAGKDARQGWNEAKHGEK